MRLSEKEKAANLAAFHEMSPAKKLEHIYTYFRWPILLGLIALIVLGSLIRHFLTKKEPVLYLAAVNVAVGQELQQSLTEDYLYAAGLDASRMEVFLYGDLYVSEDPDTVNREFAYASKIKIMGSIESRQLDAVIMNREAYDLFSASGFLLDLPAFLAGNDPLLLRHISPMLTDNEVILEDNAIEWKLDEVPTHEVVTETLTNGIAVNGLPLFREAGFADELYLGIIANTERAEQVLAYLNYLTAAPQP